MNEPEPPTPSAIFSALGEETGTAVERVVGVGSRVAFVNFPDIANVGDPLLWLGARAILDDLDACVLYQARPRDFDPDAISALGDLDTIILNGGGNFGDVWAGQHQIRQQVFDRFRDRAILQLPQTLWYDDVGNLERDAARISLLDDVTLMWREHQSYELAQRVFDATNILVPDTAFAYPARALSSGGTGITWLLRTDRESTRRESDLGEAGRLDTDWVAEPDGEGSTIATLRRSLDRAVSDPLVNAREIDTIHRKLAVIRVRRGIALLSHGAVTITDRLHGVILSAAINIPVVALDNRSHKVHGVIETHLHHLSTVYKATTLDNATSLAAELLERSV